MDGEFECLMTDMAGIGVTGNPTAKGEHVPGNERQNRVTKEQTRCLVSILPFKRLPVAVFIELMKFVTMWLNNFPPKDRILQTLSPREIVHGTTLDVSKHCKIPFGAYCQVYEDPDPSNNMTEQTTGAICLGPIGNLQGGYRFLNLTTGRCIKRKQHTFLPMPADIIQ
eukprot:3613216-Ditylum_brightwellii.AAC.2